MTNKVSFRTLPITEPPIPAGGGRILTPTGELTQILNGQEFKLLVYLEFKPDDQLPRGNHYHALKTETLYVIQGRLRAVYHDVETGETATKILTTGDMATVSPGCAHVYYADEYTQAVEVADTAFNPADTIPYRLEDK